VTLRGNRYHLETRKPLGSHCTPVREVPIASPHAFATAGNTLWVVAKRGGSTHLQRYVITQYYEGQGHQESIPFNGVVYRIFVGPNNRPYVVAENYDTGKPRFVYFDTQGTEHCLDMPQLFWPEYATQYNGALHYSVEGKHVVVSDYWQRQQALIGAPLGIAATASHVYRLLRGAPHENTHVLMRHGVQERKLTLR
jgi:hypothetical protein